MSVEIFTPKVRRSEIFGPIVRIIGPAHTWSRPQWKYPWPFPEWEKDKNELFRTWCNTVAERIGSHTKGDFSGKYVQMQIGFACAAYEQLIEVMKHRGNDWLYTFHDCKAAAKEAGFLRTQDLAGFGS